METTLRYYGFDWDDNILHMPTKIHMIHNGVPTDVLPGQFAKIRNDVNWELSDHAFTEFNDYGIRGVYGFIDDIDEAIANKQFGPSWDAFIESILSCSIIMVITARGHEPQTLKNAIKHIIDKHFTLKEKVVFYYNLDYIAKKHKINNSINLIDWYLDQCLFMGVYSEAFQNTFNFISEPAHPEKAKEMILNYFINQINEKNAMLGYKFTVSMSDDDAINLKVIKKFFSLSHWSNVIGVYVFDTSDPENVIRTEY
jgi:hypothetical protein